MFHYLRRFPHAIRGLRHGALHDRSVQHTLIGGVLVLTALEWLIGPLAPIDRLYFALAWALVLITEFQNSALEAALDRLHPERHDSIKVSKDLAAGATLIAGFVAFAVTLGIVVRNF